MMNLRALLEKSSDAELLREMIGFTAQRLMELEVEGVTGAAYGEKKAITPSFPVRQPDLPLFATDPVRLIASWSHRKRKGSNGLMVSLAQRVGLRYFAVEVSAGT